MAADALERTKAWKCFGGEQLVFAHASRSTGTRMEFSIYLPPQSNERPCPVVFYLSGLTCTWENATTKAGFQRVASELGLILVCPDTSPRGTGVADDPAYDFGMGAGFYVNATEAPWSQHYRMYDYVVDELPELVYGNFPADRNRTGISGHSMGGHGALTIAIKNPDRYRSLSAFSPIVAPSQVPWGQKALTGYLGGDRAKWSTYDACALLADRGWPGDVLIDQGAADEFLSTQLRPELFEQVCKSRNVNLNLRRQPGYDHSYYFIATFIEDHLKFHAERLR